MAAADPEGEATLAMREALTQALVEHGDRLYSLALRITRDPDLASDAVQEAFATALAALGIKIPATPSPLNLFMNIPWTPDGTLAWAEPVSTAGSYAVLRAEMDLVIVFSACPQDVLPINGRTGHTTEAHFSIE